MPDPARKVTLPEIQRKKEQAEKLKVLSCLTPDVERAEGRIVPIFR